MEAAITRETLRISDIRHAWGDRKGFMSRKPGERPFDHLQRMEAGGAIASPQKVVRYASALGRGCNLPPPLVVRVGRTLKLIDGCHTTAATAFLGRATIDAVVVPAASDVEADEFAQAFWDSEHADKMPEVLDELPLAT